MTEGDRQARIGAIKAVKKGRRVMNVKSPLDDFCTVDEAAEFLRMSRHNVYRLHKTGKLEMVKFMGRTYVSERSLRDIIKEIKPLPTKN